MLVKKEKNIINYIWYLCMESNRAASYVYSWHRSNLKLQFIVEPKYANETLKILKVLYNYI